MKFLTSTMRVLFTILMVLLKFSAFMIAMFAGAYLLAPMGTINSKNVDLSSFTSTPNEMMMVLFNSEYFSGYLFSVTIALVAFIAYLMWQLHEVAVHRAEENRSAHVQLVFALSLCGLFLHKAWWVLAIIIAFTNWRQIGIGMSDVIRRGYSWPSDHINNDTSMTER